MHFLPMNVSITTNFVADYRALFKVTTEVQYNYELARIKRRWRARKSLIEYVRREWLEPYKTRIVSAWTDTVSYDDV